jgi:hypothetical protein
MENLKTITGVVKSILAQYKQTRNNDGLLYLKVLEHYSHENGVDIRLLSVPYFLREMRSMGFPAFESVRRARQKIQATYPELAACEAVESLRTANQEVYREYARSEV